MSLEHNHKVGSSSKINLIYKGTFKCLQDVNIKFSSRTESFHKLGTLKWEDYILAANLFEKESVYRKIFL